MKKNWVAVLGGLWCLMVWVVSAGMVYAGEMTAAEERELFSFQDLGSVDLSPKTVAVEVYMSPQPALRPLVRRWPRVWARVQRFYEGLGVQLVQISGREEPGPLAPGRRLRMELLTQKEFLHRTLAAFKVEPQFEGRLLKACQGKTAFSHLHLSVSHVSFPVYQQAVSAAAADNADLQDRWTANLIIHELGHLLGLYHAQEFEDDPIPEILTDGRTPNFMGHELFTKAEVGYVPFQQLLVHSYLGGGKVWRQYRAVAFDVLRYLELVRQHNDYRQGKPGRSGKDLEVRSWGLLSDDDDEEDDEDDLEPA